MDNGDNGQVAGQAFATLRAFEARIAAVEPSRLAEAVRVIVGHLHQAAYTLRPSPAEFRAVLEFLTETGHYADARRQEWLLLADGLGLSSTVHELNACRGVGATPDTASAPFYRPNAPHIAMGESISRDGVGEPMLVTGTVRSVADAPVAGAQVEVWQANAEGRYENQEPDRQPDHNLRGRLKTDAEGRFRFLSVKPGGYELPADGPVGRLLTRLGLPLSRPAHINLRVSAKGYETLTTHIFDRADPVIGRDAIFGVQPALLADFKALPSPDGRAAHSLDVNLVLCPVGSAYPVPGRSSL